MLLHDSETVEQLEPEALIEEARARGRRRRRFTAAVVALAAAGVALAFGVARHGPAPAHAVAQSLPHGVFANATAFAGHGRLAFVSRGRLFVLDGASGRVTALTRTGQRASDPQFSPNGAWLIYTVGARVGLARADGRSARIAGAGEARFLPDGRLLLGDGVYRVGASRLTRVAAAPKGSVAWSADGSRFAFLSRSIVRGRSGAFHGVELLQVAGSLTGTRTTWLSHPISFTRSTGFAGYAINGFVVLPHRQGLLYWVDPLQSASLAADGQSVYELRAPGARPVKLGVTVGETISIGPAGRLALGAGGNRYAWMTKTVETCSTASARCAPLRAGGKLTLDPAWSSDGALAFVEAAAEPTAGTFDQQAIARWYATRNLWLLRPRTRTPTRIAGTQGAATPTWSTDGRSLLYVSGDALWLIPRLGARPERIAAPLFPQRSWPSDYGRIDWADQFAWSQ